MNLFTTDWAACFDNNVVTTSAPPKLTCVFIILSNVINAALVLAAVVAVFLITYAAFQYVTSAGDKEKVDNARKRITYAIIGLVVILSAIIFINFIAQFTGLDLDQIGVSTNP